MSSPSLQTTFAPSTSTSILRIYPIHLSPPPPSPQAPLRAAPRRLRLRALAARVGGRRGEEGRRAERVRQRGGARWKHSVANFHWNVPLEPNLVCSLGHETSRAVRYRSSAVHFLRFRLHRTRPQLWEIIRTRVGLVSARVPQVPPTATFTPLSWQEFFLVGPVRVPSGTARQITCEPETATNRPTQSPPLRPLSQLSPLRTKPSRMPP